VADEEPDDGGACAGVPSVTATISGPLTPGPKFADIRSYARRAVVEVAAATGRKRLWATVGSWNAPSLRVLEKLGFHRDHVDPDEDGKGARVWLTRALP